MLIVGVLHASSWGLAIGGISYSDYLLTVNYVIMSLPCDLILSIIFAQLILHRRGASSYSLITYFGCFFLIIGMLVGFGFEFVEDRSTSKPYKKVFQSSQTTYSKSTSLILIFFSRFTYCLACALQKRFYLIRGY